MAMYTTSQAYSNISYLLSSFHGNSADHEPVDNTSGSTTVILYSIVSSLVRVKRSLKRMVSVDGFNGGEPGTPALVIAGLPLKFVVSTTSVLPSQRPLDSPNHCLIDGSSAGRPLVGMIRASWAISMTITTYPGDCMIRMPLV